LVIAKNSGSPSMTVQWIGMSRSRTYPTRHCSISATPPPTAVELMFQMVAPPERSRNPAAAAISRAYRCPPMTCVSAATGRGGTST
jgi:hypothetical protein